MTNNIKILLINKNTNKKIKELNLNKDNINMNIIIEVNNISNFFITFY